MGLFARLYDGLIRGLAAIAGCLLVMIFVFIMQDVILRNLLISPPRFSAPASEYALLYVTMFAAPWLVRTRGHVLLEVLRRRLKPPSARVLEVAVYCVCIAICTTMSWFAIELLAEAIRSGEEDHRAIEIPRTWLFAPAAIAFPLMTIEFVRFLTGRGSLYDEALPGADGM